MTDHPDEERFPAVGRVREELRSELMRAARDNPRARSGFLRRRRFAVLAAVAVVAAPAGLAAAGVFDSAEIQYECQEAELDEGYVLGAPAEGPDAVEPDSLEEPGAQPENPCAEDEGGAQRDSP